MFHFENQSADDADEADFADEILKTFFPWSFRVMAKKGSSRRSLLSAAHLVFICPSSADAFLKTEWFSTEYLCGALFFRYFARLKEEFVAGVENGGQFVGELFADGAAAAFDFGNVALARADFFGQLDLGEPVALPVSAEGDPRVNRRKCLL
ncbi:MAG TPA: hypothetical protein PLU72_09295 [Candidatus Ozemobacteraceae bacterium]|nr:hypothetical protein [Candidatus Ozemobacteraceae bacterium]